MIIFIIIIIVFILFIFVFAFDTDDKRGFLNTVGLDLSEEQIENSKEKDLNRRAKALISWEKKEIKNCYNYESLNRKERIQEVYNIIESKLFDINDEAAAKRALEILEEELKKK